MKTTVKFIGFLLTLIFTVSVNAQSAIGQPDYDLIKKNIEDKSSEFYYPEMLKKLKTNDTLFTADQYKYLYYGYILQDDFTPFRDFEKGEELTKILFGEEDLNTEEAIPLLNEALELYPLDLYLMSVLAMAYLEKGDENNGMKMLTNFYNFLDVIMNSGNGYSCDSAIHVISVDDSAILMNMMNLEAVEQELVDDKCDYYKLAENQFGIEWLYFDIERILEAADKEENDN